MEFRDIIIRNYLSLISEEFNSLCIWMMGSRVWFGGYKVKAEPFIGTVVVVCIFD